MLCLVLFMFLWIIYRFLLKTRDKLLVFLNIWKTLCAIFAHARAHSLKTIFLTRQSSETRKEILVGLHWCAQRKNARRSFVSFTLFETSAQSNWISFIAKLLLREYCWGAKPLNTIFSGRFLLLCRKSVETEIQVKNMKVQSWIKRK